MKTPTLVLDGHLKSALCAVRTLGRKKIDVYCGAERSSALASRSRYVNSAFIYPSPKDNQENFIEEIKKHANLIKKKTGLKPVVYCFSDATYLSLARVHKDLDEVLLFFLPKSEQMEIAFDKQSTYDLANDIGVPTIKTYTFESFDTIQYPAVVKNRHSIVWINDSGFSGTANFVFSREELEKKVSEISIQSGEIPLVQKFICGEEYGVEVVCNRGEILTQFAHRRIRSLSPSGGAAVVKETALNTPEVLIMKEYTQKLVKELHWNGPMMVEFKIDNNDNSVKLMELNGRFWGSLPLAQVAGFDFIGHYYKLTLGKEIKPKIISDKYVRTRHFFGDLNWLLKIWFKKDSLRCLLYPSRLKALWDFKTEVFKSQGDIWDSKDPLPSFFEVIDIIKR